MIECVLIALSPMAFGECLAEALAPREPAVLEAGEMDRGALADQVGMTASGGTFGTYLSRARTARLLRTEGSVVRLGEAFEGLA